MRNLAPYMISALLLGAPATLFAKPPFQGTVWADPDIITETDPSTLTRFIYTATAHRQCFDRRVGEWSRTEVHIYRGEFDDGKHSEFWVNAEFDRTEARVHAERFARALGRLPAVLRHCSEAVEIHGGDALAGGNSTTRPRRVHLHVGTFAQDTGSPGFLEETFVHEAAHACEDAYRHSAGWRTARNADPEFISEYARDHPDREDFAETLLPWLAVRFRPERVSASYKQDVVATIPARLAYLDEAIGDEPGAVVPLLTETVVSLAFVPNARSTWRAWVRIMNGSKRRGTVEVHALDDAGRQFGPVEYTLEPLAARNISVADLEATLGTGVGHWRIDVRSRLPVDAITIIRE